MVNLTAAAAARLSPVSYRKAEDMLNGRNRGYGRKSIPDKKVAFIEVTPLALKNRVSLQASKDKDKACMNEMMEVIACLGKYDNQQSLCAKELGTFSNCFEAFKKQQVKTKAFRESGEQPLGRFAQLDGPQLNSYMKNFMQSARTGERHNDKVYKNCKGKYGGSPVSSDKSNYDER